MSSKVQMSELMLSDHTLLITMLFSLNAEIKYSLHWSTQPFQPPWQAPTTANILLLWIRAHAEHDKKTWAREFFF